MRPAIARIAVAAAFFAMVGGCASSRTLSGAVSDLGANAELKAVLFADRHHDYSDVDLTLYDGRLMLTGTMRDEAGHKQLIEDAWKADGVKQVIDEILIAGKTSLGRGLDDTRIDQTIRAKLIADSAVTSSNYKMSVSRGVVYLLGVARDEKELDAALATARGVHGVKTVVSHVVYQTLADAAH
ncbi:MAG TPA: BON domain-containing protein [Parvularculaceae bacterium]|nr:BON domain-containing protein [Parvularculaceae bacterium]